MTVHGHGIRKCDLRLRRPSRVERFLGVKRGFETSLVPFVSRIDLVARLPFVRWGRSQLPRSLVRRGGFDLPDDVAGPSESERC